MLTVDRLHFGEDRAEEDLDRSSGLLRAGFHPTPELELLRSGARPIVLGPEGSGKSALGLHLLGELEGEARACRIALGEASIPELRAFSLPQASEAEAKRLLFRAVLLVATAKMCLVRHGHLAGSLPAQGPLPEAVEAIRAFLETRGELSLSALSDRFGLLRRHAAWPGGPLGAQIEGLAEPLRAAAAALFPADAPLLLMVDPLESIGADDPRTRPLLHGLLAARELGLGPHVRVLLFLRSELYESLDPEARQSLEGLLLPLRWSAEQLARMLEARGRASLSSVESPERTLMGIDDFSGGADDDLSGSDSLAETGVLDGIGDSDELDGAGEDDLDALTDQLFEGEGEQTFPGLARGSAQGAAEVPPMTFWELFPEHLRERPLPELIGELTLDRPRDVIRLFNLACDLAATEGTSRIREQTFELALACYSGHRLQETVRAWAAAAPFLSGALAALVGSPYLITRERLSARLTALAPRLELRHPERRGELSADRLIGTLYRAGLIGVRRGSDFVYVSGDPRPIEAGDRDFILHPAFRPALGATSALHSA